MIDQGYLIEQGVTIAVTLALHLGFWLQFVLEKRRPNDGPAKDSVVRSFEKQRGFAAVFNIQYVCNRIGILASFLQLVRLIDPVNVHGIYPRELNEFISYNISAILLTLFVAFVAITARIRYSMQNTSLPRPLVAYFWTTVVLVFIGANGLPLASHLPTANHFWTYGVFLWSFIAVELSLLFVLDFQVCHLKRLFTSYQMSHEGDTALALIRATRKLNYQGNPRVSSLQVKPATKPPIPSASLDPNSLLQPEVSQISTTAVNVSESRRNSWGSAAVSFLTAMFGPRETVPHSTSDSNNPRNSSRSVPHQQHAIEMSSSSLAGTLSFPSLSNRANSSQTHSSSPFLSASHSSSSVTGLGHNHQSFIGSSYSSTALSSLSEEKRSGHDHSIRIFRSASPIAEESISRVVSDVSLCAPHTSFGTRVPTDHGPSAFSVVVSVPSPIVAPIVPSLLPSSAPPDLNLFQPIASPDSSFRLESDPLPLVATSSEPPTPSSVVNGVPSPSSALEQLPSGPYSAAISAAMAAAVPPPAGPRLFLPRFSSSQSHVGSILGRPVPSLIDPTQGQSDQARVSRAPSTASSTEFSTNDMPTAEDPRSPGRTSDMGSGVFNLQHGSLLSSRTPSTSFAEGNVFCRGQSEPIGQPIPSTASSSSCVSPSESAQHLSVRGQAARAPSDTPARPHRPSQQRPSRHTDSPAGLTMVTSIITGTVAEVPGSPSDSPGRWSISPTPLHPLPPQQCQSAPDTPNLLKVSHLSAAAIPSRHERSRVSTSVGGSTKEGLRNEKIEQSLSRLTMVQIVTHVLLAVITGLQAYIGYQTFTGESDQFIGYQVSPDSYSPSQSEFLWIQDILLCLVLWYSWTPLKHIPAHHTTRSPIVSARRTANLLSPKRRAHAERRPSASVGGPIRAEAMSPAESQDAVSNLASPQFEYRPSGRTRRASAPAVLIASQSARAIASSVAASDNAGDNGLDQSTPKRTRSDRGVLSPPPIRVHSLDDASIAVGSHAAAQSNFGRMTTFELPLFKSWKEQQRNRRRLRRVISVQTQLAVDARPVDEV